jgi:copper homeostasis protein
MLLEVPVFDIQSALKAQQAGAHRIELCASLADGGITPSPGMITKAKELLEIPFFVMIRPRGGNFTYSDEEISIMLSDIEFCRDLNVRGIVTGALTTEGNVNITVCVEMVKAAGDMQLTFHRAFDRTADPFKALENIIECGFHRILTSGQKETAPEGARLIADLNKQSNGRIIIMPGSGVNETNLKELHNICACSEYHSSAKVRSKEHYSVTLLSDSPETWTVGQNKIHRMLDVFRNISENQ